MCEKVCKSASGLKTPQFCKHKQVEVTNDDRENNFLYASEEIDKNVLNNLLKKSTINYGFRSL